MGFIETIRKKAKASGSRIALPECGNILMMRAAARAAESEYIIPVVVGIEHEMRALCRERGIDEDLFEFADVENEAYRRELAQRYSEIPDMMLGEKAIFRRTENPLFMALVMEKVGDAVGMISGLDAATAEVINAAQMVIGLAEDSLTPSSCGFFEVGHYPGSQGTLFGYGDSAICVDPTAEELAGIAIACCETFVSLVGRAPHCAMLSYSTCGSGTGGSVDKVRQAVSIAKEKRPDLMIDGEFQLDAAINGAIAAKKVNRENDVAGRADLIIWPNLDVGNIGLKLIQQFANPQCYGPFLQGCFLCRSSMCPGERRKIPSLTQWPSRP